MTKQEIRQNLLSLRKNVTERERKDLLIATRLLSQEFYKNAKSVMTYISYNGEVDTLGLIDKMLCDKKILSAPKCVTECDIEAKMFSSLQELKQGKYGILEPKGLTARDLDLIIVPGVAFNEKLHRIGYGAGYYDRFLRGKKAITVGLFYEMQRADFAEEENDVGLDYIITEEKIYSKGLI